MSDALSKERIAALREYTEGSVGVLCEHIALCNVVSSAHSKRSLDFEETILALIDERARLREQHARDRVVLNRLCGYFNFCAEGAADRWQMKRLLDAWKAGGQVTSL